MDLSALPALNAALNFTAILLLVAGRRLARRGEIDRHRRVMAAAFGVSSLFLLLYVTHKVWRNFENTPFHAEGWPHTAYLVLLASHVLLAMSVPVIAIALIVLGLRDQRVRHRRLARLGWPIWMYVSVTGVLIYLLLYPLNPDPLDPPPTPAPAEAPSASDPQSGAAAGSGVFRTGDGRAGAAPRALVRAPRRSESLRRSPPTKCNAQVPHGGVTLCLPAEASLGVARRSRVDPVARRPRRA